MEKTCTNKLEAYFLRIAVNRLKSTLICFNIRKLIDLQTKLWIYF